MGTFESADPSQYFQGSLGVCSSKTGKPRENSFIPQHNHILKISLFPLHYEDAGAQRGSGVERELKTWSDPFQNKTPSKS